jgi:hypothetical protein
VCKEVISSGQEQPFAVELVNVLDISRSENIKGSAILNLSRQVGRCAETEADPNARPQRKLFPQLGESVHEIRRRRDRYLRRSPLIIRRRVARTIKREQRCEDQQKDER